MDHKDIAGRDIKVGDYIIYAALWDRSATLKYGKVTGLAERDGAWCYNAEPRKTPTVKIYSADRDFNGKWELQKKGHVVTLGYLDRLSVIEPHQVPADAKKLLDF